MRSIDITLVSHLCYHSYLYQMSYTVYVAVANVYVLHLAIWLNYIIITEILNHNNNIHM